MSGTDLLLFLLFAVLVIGVALYKQSRLNDPTDRGVIYREEVKTGHCLPPGPVQAALFRQSGNLYRDLGTFASADEAVAAVMSSFKRAGIDSVSVVKNSPSRYEIVRLHRSHGKQEGKKMGRAVIVPSSS